MVYAREKKVDKDALCPIMSVCLSVAKFDHNFLRTAYSQNISFRSFKCVLKQFILRHPTAIAIAGV